MSRLGAAARYRHFVKWAADWEEVWSLYEGGWLMMHDDDGRLLLPLRPLDGMLMRTASWGAKVEALGPIALDELLQEWLPGLSKEDRAISVFPVIGADGSIHPSLDTFERAIRAEKARYCDE